MKPFLELNSINYSYNSNNSKSTCLVDINLKIEKGEFISIIDPFNPAKSIILSLISGDLSVNSGEIIINTNYIDNLLMTIGYISQKNNLFECKTIYKDLSASPKGKYLFNNTYDNSFTDVTNIKHFPDFNNDNLFKSEQKISNLSSYNPSNLSKYTKQFLALMCALISGPELLLLDMIFSTLEYNSKMKILDDIYYIIKNDKKTVILTTNNLSEAITLSDKVVILSRNPSTIKKIIPINFKDTSLTPSQKTNTKEFVYYFNTIWKELN